jgi:hypothetical protein
MILRDGKNRIRDLIDGDKFKGQMGTGTTAPTEDDTSLGTADATTLFTLTSTLSDKQILFDYNCPTTTGSGTTYAEFELQLNSGTDHLTRQTFAGLGKLSTEEWQISTFFRIL